MSQRDFHQHIADVLAAAGKDATQDVVTKMAEQLADVVGSDAHADTNADTFARLSKDPEALQALVEGNFESPEEAFDFLSRFFEEAGMELTQEEKDTLFALVESSFEELPFEGPALTVYKTLEHFHDEEKLSDAAFADLTKMIEQLIAFDVSNPQAFVSVLEHAITEYGLERAQVMEILHGFPEGQLLVLEEEPTAAFSQEELPIEKANYVAKEDNTDLLQELEEALAQEIPDALPTVSFVAADTFDMAQILDAKEKARVEAAFDVGENNTGVVIPEPSEADLIIAALSRLNTRLDEMRAVVVDATAQWQAAVTKVKAYESYASATQELETARETLSTLQNSAAEKQAVLDALLAQKAALLSEYEKEYSELEVFDTNLTDLHSTLQEKEAVLTDFAKAAAIFDAEKADLLRTVEENEGIYETLSQRRDIVLGRVEYWQGEIDAMKPDDASYTIAMTSLSQGQTELDTIDTEMTELTETQKVLMASYESIDAEHRVNLNEQEALQADIDTINQEIEDFEYGFYSEDNDVDDIVNLITRLDKTLLSAESSALSASNAALAQEDLVSFYSDKVEEKTPQNFDQSFDLQTLQNDADTIHNKISDLQGHENALQDEITLNENQLARLVGHDLSHEDLPDVDTDMDLDDLDLNDVQH